MLSPYVRELSIGDMMRGSVRLYRCSFLPLLLCYMIPSIPATILCFYALYAFSLPLRLLALGAVVVCSLFGYTGITLCVSDACTGNKPSFLRSLVRGRVALGTLILASLLLAPLVLLGFFLLFIPGIILLLWFLYVPVVVVLERRGVWSAIKRSRQLSKGFNLRNLGVLVLGGLMLGAAYIFATLIMVSLAAVLGNIPSSTPTAITIVVIGYLGGILFTYVTYPVFFIMIVLTYYDLRARKEGYDSMALTAELVR